MPYPTTTYFLPSHIKNGQRGYLLPLLAFERDSWPLNLLPVVFKYKTIWVCLVFEKVTKLYNEMNRCIGDGLFFV